MPHTRYRNTPETAVFAKRHVLYQPLRREFREDAVVVVCEGALDGLAIAAVAASGRTASPSHAETLFPVSPSGTALTIEQVRLVLRLGRRPPVLCGDGDAAGRRATASWATAVIAEGRECLVTLLPGDQDPAEWLARHKVNGLGAFMPRDPAHRGAARGSGQESGPEVGSDTHPRAPWRLITGAVCDELCHVGYTGDELASAVVRRLAAIGDHLVSPGAHLRLALDAGDVLEEKHLGRASYLASEMTDAITA
ncbi:MAG: toprim domain-containing protein [Acidimicrobiales bacterium]